MHRHSARPLIGFLAAAALLTSASAGAAPINLIDYANVVGNRVLGFDGLFGGTPLAVDINGELALDGVTFNERFAGQTLDLVPVTSPLFPGSTTTNHDGLSGAPGPGLTLLSGNTQENLSITGGLISGGGVDYRISGNAPEQGGFVRRGEGAVSFRFDDEQSELGFQVFGAGGISNRQQIPSGPVTAAFFRNDGSLIDSLLLNLAGGFGPSSFGFQRDGGLADIAGVSLTNIDAFGVSYDNLVYSFSASDDESDTDIDMPEPSSLMTLAVALAGFGVAARRRRNKVR